MDLLLHTSSRSLRRSGSGRSGSVRYILGHLHSLLGIPVLVVLLFGSLLLGKLNLVPLSLQVNAIDNFCGTETTHTRDHTKNTCGGRSHGRGVHSLYYYLTLENEVIIHY